MSETWMANGRVRIGGIDVTRIDSLGEEKVGLDFLSGWVALVRDPEKVPLVEAAPDLLAACSAIVDCWERGSDGQTLANALRTARAAIARAKGQGATREVYPAEGHPPAAMPSAKEGT